jgi:hypothetical protein
MSGMGLPSLWSFLVGVLAASVLLASRQRMAGQQDGSTAGREGGIWIAVALLSTVALVYGALLGFTVVVAWEQFSSAEANVTNESSTLATMYRQTVSLPAPEQTTMRGFSVSTPRPFKRNGTVKAVARQATQREPRLPTCTACLASNNHSASPPIRSMRRSATSSTC